MKRPNLVRWLAGILLVVLGTFVLAATRASETRRMVSSGDCTLSVLTAEPAATPPRGSVLILHGLVANGKLMDYYTRGFLNAGLRVIVPDFPGHGASPPPFSFERAEACGEQFLREGIRTGEIDPARTVILGHSLGGAIGLRIASRIPVAGVVALSPAPMLPVEGASPEALFYRAPERLPESSLILEGSSELPVMHRAAQALITLLPHGVAKFQVIPWASHSSLLFDAQALRASVDWTATALHLPTGSPLPNRAVYAGFAAGALGVLLLIGATVRLIPPLPQLTEPAPRLPALLPYVEIAAATTLAMLLVRFTGPLKLVAAYSADYLTTVVAASGCLLLLLNYRLLRRLGPYSLATSLSCALAGVLGSFLFFGWLRVSIASSGLSFARLWRMCVVFLGVIPICLAEELLLGPAGATAWARARRLAQGMLLRGVAWLILVAGVFHLHTRQVLLVIIVPYLAAFSLLQRLGVDLARRHTGSGLGAAFFGAILTAVFLVLVFPLT